MNWKRVISGVLAAAMLFALPVQLPVSAEGTEAVGQADGWEKLTTPEPLDECNAFFYSKDDQTFEKITHPEKDVKTADGIVDYYRCICRGGACCLLPRQGERYQKYKARKQLCHISRRMRTFWTLADFV